MYSFEINLVRGLLTIESHTIPHQLYAFVDDYINKC